MKVRKAHQRGHTNIGWLKSYHSFSFGDYYDPEYIGFRSLQVINQDTVTPRGGFPLHAHSDMEIFSYVIDGTIAHEDTLGNRRELRTGEIQLMSAGKGIRHSEFNPSEEVDLHFLQIWLKPFEKSITPQYSEWKPQAGTLEQNKVLIISADGRDRSAKIHQDAFVYEVTLTQGETVTHTLEKSRGMWVQVIKGEIKVNEVPLTAGDGVSSEEEDEYHISADSDALVLLFDLA